MSNREYHHYPDYDPDYQIDNRYTGHGHTRNDSMYSMDSFVAEQPDTDENDNIDRSDPTFEYISPSSSSAMSIDSRKVQNSRDSVQRNISVETKIGAESLSDHGGHDLSDAIENNKRSAFVVVGNNESFSGEGLQSITPALSFFHQSYFHGESDDNGDGGSIVFKQTHDRDGSNQDIPATHQQFPQQPSAKYNNSRDRLPSFDSVGSSGSVVRMTPSKPAPKPPMTGSAPSAPRILPYHERRKLMQQRQVQQQQRSHASRQDPVPPRPDRLQQPFPTNLPYGMPFVIQPLAEQTPNPVEVAASQNQSHFNPTGPSYPTHSSVTHYQGMPIHPSTGMQSHANASAPHPDRRATTPRSTSSSVDRPPSGNYGSTSSKARISNKEQHHPFITIPAVSEFPRPPIPPGPPQALTNNASDSGGNAQTSSSFDSSDDNIMPNNTLNEIVRQTVVPPPPPPPPPFTSSHLRHDSMGSVSSLGSIDRSIREENPMDKKKSSKNIFQRLNPFTAKVHTPVPDTGPGMVTIDFHRKNQEFLSTVQQRNVQQQYVAGPSPKNTTRRGQAHPMNTPPPSRGGHRCLHSISNDDWTEVKEGALINESDEFGIRPDVKNDAKRRKSSSGNRVIGVSDTTDSRTKNDHTGKLSGLNSIDRHYIRPGGISSSDASSEEDDISYHHQNDVRPSDERSMLLPPSGISSNEYYDRKHSDYGAGRSNKTRSSRRNGNNEDFLKPNMALRVDNSKYQETEERSKRRHKKKKKNRRRKKRSLPSDDVSSSSSISSSSASSRNYQLWKHKRAALLENERRKFIEQWRSEVLAKDEVNRKIAEEKSWRRRFMRFLDSKINNVIDGCTSAFQFTEAFVANLPSTVGAIALACATLGVDWFKFAEENLSTCQRVHFHSAQCTFPEFPGCFYCDKNAILYKAALNFHFTCSTFAAILAMSFLAKLIIARRVVFDELSNPTSAAPAGLICMTLAIVFAGHGILGLGIVIFVSSIHLCLALWFIYLALAYSMMPDPSWFPNTVGIGIGAVKTWLYFPVMGQFLMVISLSLNILFFPISMIRVAFNEKIPATVAWMQMSAPDVSLYALTIMAQPTFEEEYPDINKYQKVHRMVYLPCMHVLFTFCIVGMLASVNAVFVRWKEFRKIPFSPAHAAFCCPTLSHANAVQAYRAAIISFSTFPEDGIFRKLLYIYWLAVLIGGTVVTVWITSKFLWSLPSWTQINVDGEIEPPAPYETAMTLTNMVSAGETLVQPYVSPSVLQANETGTLVLVRGHRYVRTRQITAVGFQPLMNSIQMEVERELLLDWVGKNQPRRRHRTLSVPGIDFSYGSPFGSENSGVYGFDTNTPWTNRPTPNFLSQRSEVTA